MSFFGKRKTGDILARFADAGTIKNVMSAIALSILMDTSLALIVGVILYFMNPKLFVVIIIMTIINIILVYIYKRPYKKINLIQMEQSAKLNSTMIESLNSLEMIKSNSIEEDRMEKIENDYIDLVKTSFNENVLSNSQSVISGALSTIGNLVIMWIGATLVMNGDITLGALMTFTSMAGFFMNPVGNLVGLQLQIQEANIAMKRLSEIYDVDEEKLGEVKDTNLDGDIKLENITFRYGMRRPVLNSINLSIRKGDKIAIVGESGSGKTTLSKLLLGLYEPEEGNIYINDKTISEIGLINLRNKISYVSQNVELFSGSIRDNIKCVNPNISDEKIDIALKLSGCDFVRNMPNGIDTYLDEAGVNLSGGERQRLTLARALVKDFDLLIMDEATSNLDFISEKRIYDTLFNSNINKTMIFIAHRLSTIRKCNYICVMDKGCIVEYGTHDELLNLKGKYYDLWISQVGSDYKEETEEVKISDEVSYE